MKSFFNSAREKFQNLATTTGKKIGFFEKTKIDELVDILKDIYDRFTRIKPPLSSIPTIITKSDIINLNKNIFSEIINNNQQDILSTDIKNYSLTVFDQNRIINYIKSEYVEDFKSKIKVNNVYTFTFYYLLDLSYIFNNFFSKNERYTIKNDFNNITITFENFIINYNLNYHLYSMSLLYKDKSDEYLMRNSIPPLGNIINNIDSNNREIDEYITNIKSQQIDKQRKEQGDSLNKIETKKQELNKSFSEIIGIPNITLYDGLIEIITTKYDRILSSSDDKDYNDNNKYNTSIQINDIVYHFELSKNNIDQLKDLNTNYKELLREEKMLVSTGQAGGSHNLRHSIDLIIQSFKKQRPSLNINPDLLYNCILSSSKKNKNKPLRKYNQRTKR